MYIRTIVSNLFYLFIYLNSVFIAKQLSMPFDKAAINNGI